MPPNRRRRCTTSWPPVSPSPVPVRRYRYTRLRWRLSVRAFDLAGSVLVWFWRLLMPAKPVKTPSRILVVQLDHLGDAILSSPVFSRLRDAYPHAKIDVLASLSNRAAFEINPNIDEVLTAERNWFERRSGGWAAVSAVLSLGLRLRRHRYDLGIDVRGDVLSVLVLALAGVKRRLGWAMGGGGFLLTDVAEWVPGRHEVGSRLALLRKLGLDDDGPPRTEVHVRDADRSAVARRLRKTGRPARLPVPATAPPARSGPSPDRPDGPVAVLPIPRPADKDSDTDDLRPDAFDDREPLLAVHVGAGTPAKRWPIEHWSTLLNRFLEDGWRVAVLGGPDDRLLAQRLPVHDRLLDWTGQLSVAESAALLERADLFIGADSGPAHLAASAGTTSVILFSGTNQHRQWRPFSRRSLVLRHRVPCRPCHRKVCPLEGHPCMTGLSPDRVYRAARRWWALLHRQESPHAPL